MLKIFRTAAEIHHFFSLRFASPRLDHLTTVILKKTLARQAASATIQYTIIVVIVQLCTTDDRQSRLGVHWWSSCLRHGLIPLELAPHGAIQGAVVEVIWAWHRAYNGHLEGIHGHTVLPVRTHPNIIWLYTYIYISNSIQFRSDL